MANSKEKRPLTDVMADFNDLMIKFSQKNGINSVELLGVVDIFKESLIQQFKEPESMIIKPSPN